jgi:molybdate transport system substrate-binding protein
MVAGVILAGAVHASVEPDDARLAGTVPAGERSAGALRTDALFTGAGPAGALSVGALPAGVAAAGAAAATEASRAAVAATPPPLRVLAAISLGDALTQVGDAYTRAHGRPVRFSLASSGTLARQVEAGADADVFFAADAQWMDYLAARGLVDVGTRDDVLGNRLVLVAPRDTAATPLVVGAGVDLATRLGRGRLAIGDPDSVPAGRYAQAALSGLGLWAQVAQRLVLADNVRAALAFVASGEAPLGIVYDTDARLETRVAVVGTFPAGSPPPIVYPVAATRQADAAAVDFIAFLRSAAARDVFTRFGFDVLPAAAAPSP